MRSRIARLARARRTTLICGETGSGKEVVARALHDEALGEDAPFLAVHCGALPESLFESELFGHTRGAFTGATERRHGLARAARGGTLFLDEIDSLSLPLQAKLLRFLESGEFRSVGSDRIERSDVWVLAATNRDLDAQVRAGDFRSDLLYRLRVMRIDLPPLRERGDDVIVLAAHFLREIVGERATFTPEALTALRCHRWPGNVRELKHCVEQAALLADDCRIDVGDLDLDFEIEIDVDAEDRSTRSGPRPTGSALQEELWTLVEERNLSLAEAVQYCERSIIDAALDAEEGNRSRAAHRLRIHVRTIFKKLRGR